MLSRKYDKGIAEILRPYNMNTNGNETKEGEETTKSRSYDLARMFREDNPRFDTTRFLEACGIKTIKKVKTWVVMG